jgi:hypothetical protein
MAKSISAQSMAKQREVLTYLQEAIGNLGYETRLYDAGEVQEILPGPLLLVGVEKDHLGRDRTIQFGFLPLPDAANFDYLSLIQCYAPLPFAVADERRAEVERQLSIVNSQTGAGYFGVTAGGNLFYRYVLATAKWSLVEVQMIQQLLLLFTHMQNHFAPIIEAAAQGENPKG